MSTAPIGTRGRARFVARRPVSGHRIGTLPHLRWRVAMLILLMAATTVLFHVGGPSFANYSALLGVIPIAFAAWFLGARIAIAVLVVEAIANVDLMGSPAGAAEVVTVQTIQGAALAVVSISVGAAHSANRRLAAALAADPVTGLANRQVFIHEVDRLLARDTNVTIGMLDLIDIDDVNETFGYDVGDEVMRTVAVSLRNEFGPSVFVAKGIHERFAVVWPATDIGDDVIGHRLLAIVDKPFTVRGAELRTRARVSVARRDATHARHGSELIRAATKALGHAARQGRSSQSAEAAGPTAGISRLEVLSDLSRAIAKNELRLYYQPILDLTTGSLRSFEALVRWQHPTRGLVPPLDFIPVAEQSGLIVALTEWVLDEALRQSREWADQAVRFPVSVNIGAKTLAVSADLAGLVDRLLTKHGVTAASLCLEVTETDVMTDPAHAATVLGQFKELGVRVEMDDFGTGYSSLAYLQKLPVDGVKIDRSFVSSLLDLDHTSAIVRAAIELSHALGLDAVAEGVETEAVLQVLKEMGCDAAQGYLISRPMPGTEVLPWVTELEHHPRVDPAPVAPVETVERATARSRGTVLVVDHQHPFRLAAHRVLSAQGYRVLHAATASEALRICAEADGKVTLVLTDVHLPDWKGDDLAGHLRQLYPEVRMMFMSADGQRKDHAVTGAFLAKPFTNRELVDGVAAVLAS